VNDDGTSTTASFELVIVFLHHFSQPLCIVISLFFINYWRTNDRIYSSAACKKNINARSLTMRLRIFKPQCYGARQYVALELSRSHFHSTRRKVRHHV